jgi:hypothetical protein
MYVYDHKYFDGLHGTHAAIGEIDGSDTGQRVKNTNEPPYRWICALDVYFASDVIRRTGLLISPRHLITTAHNLFKRSTTNGQPSLEAQKVTVTPGLDGTTLLGKQERRPDPSSSSLAIGGCPTSISAEFSAGI